MRKHLYRLAKWGVDKFGPQERTVNVRSMDELTELLDSGFRVTKLEINVQNPPAGFDPWNKTVAELSRESIRSRSLFTKFTMTLGDEDGPDVLVWIALSSYVIAKALPMLEEFEERER